MKTNELIDTIITLFDETYPMVNAYNNSDNIDVNGGLVVKLKQKENLHHGDLKDYAFHMVISGQTLTVQDIDQITINNMFDYVIETLENTSTFVNGIDNCAGMVLLGGNIDSNGETNFFDVEFTLYICQD